MISDFSVSTMNTSTYNNFDQVGINSLVKIKCNSHYDLGKQLGKLHNKKTIPKFGKIDNMYEIQYGIYKKYYPEYLECIRGMADQLDLDVDKFTNLFITFNEPVGSCSVISYKNLIGRNYDWLGDAVRTLELFSVSIKGYNQIVAIREGGFPDAISNEYIGENKKSPNVYHKNYVHPISFCVDFVNNKYLYIGMLWMNFSGKIENGLLVFDFMRKIAETCNDVNDVIKFLKIVPCGTPKFMFVADALGKQIVIEHFSGFNYHILKPSNHLLIHTNHIIYEPYIKYDNKKRRKESIERYNIIETKCEKLKPTNLLDMKVIIDNVFAEYKGKPKTIYQLLLDLPNGKIYYITKHKCYLLNELFS